MNWQYEVETLAGSSLGTLSDYFRAVVDDTEGQGGGKVGGNVAPGFLDGEVWQPKTVAAQTKVLRTVVRYTDEDGDVTSSPSAHFMDNIAAGHRLLNGHVPRYLVRTAPSIGKQRARFESVTDPSFGEDKAVYLWFLRFLDGSWEDYAQSTATGNPPTVVTKGSQRIHDPEVVFSGAGSFTVTDSSGETFGITVTSGPTFPMTVALVNGEWTATSDGGADASPYVTVTNQAVMVFEANQTISIATTVSCTARWRNRWR